MIYWNIFTVLCGALIAALSTRTWKPLATKSREQQVPLLLLTIVSMGAFIVIWSSLGALLLDFSIVAYMQPQWFTYVLTIHTLILSVLIVPALLIKLAATIVGKKYFGNHLWNVFFSKAAYLAVILTPAILEFLGKTHFKTPLFLPLSGGATLWLLFIILISRQNTEHDKTYNSRIIYATAIGIGLAVIALFTTSIIESPESIRTSIEAVIDSHKITALDLI